ncbi:MAG TPA: hypothetical protein VIT64_09125, partial [Ilumatobacteraceae bacterium]
NHRYVNYCSPVNRPKPAQIRHKGVGRTDFDRQSPQRRRLGSVSGRAITLIWLEARGPCSPQINGTLV